MFLGLVIKESTAFQVSLQNTAVFCICLTTCILMPDLAVCFMVIAGFANIQPKDVTSHILLCIDKLDT